jgi:flavodoxin
MLTGKLEEMAKPKRLIAYFSRIGNNYVAGSILNLPVGNTEVIAKKIQELTRSDIFKIEPVKSYPEDYTQATDVARAEQRENDRPALKDKVKDMGSYAVVFIGYPNWWGTMPMAVFSFLGEYDFSEKTIIPFCTHEGSGMGSSERDIQKLCPNTKMLPGLAIRGGNVGRADRDVTNWLKQLHFMG